LACGAEFSRRTFIDFIFWFRPSASYFLFARAKEKVTKEKARPTSGFRCAQLPSLRRRSEGRQDGPSLAQHASFGILPNAPLRNTCARPSDGGIWTASFGRYLNALRFDKSNANTPQRKTHPFVPGQPGKAGETRTIHRTAYLLLGWRVLACGTYLLLAQKGSYPALVGFSPPYKIGPATPN
jgi:hypothetical protein